MDGPSAASADNSCLLGKSSGVPIGILALQIVTGVLAATTLCNQTLDLLVQALLVIMFIEAWVDRKRPVLMLSHLVVAGFLQTLFYITVLVSDLGQLEPWFFITISAILTWRAYVFLRRALSGQ